ncbi:MAG: DUF2235 domain-containing protein [Verrucomicrobiota bacterium]|nr:DUF2235 domain-containing protein [Verrucomicrobiota bacterium]
MSRALLVCCDGTWNDALKKDAHTEGGEEAPSNVWNVYRCANRKEGETKVYFKGLGTDGVWDRFLGGVWGFGIGNAICQAYAWLLTHYRVGDRIYLVGFSRGAFTVRSLAGLIGCRGLNSAWANKEADELKKGIQTEYEAYRNNEPSSETKPDIHFLGVFDTVGKLGVPDNRGIANLFDKPTTWAFHDTTLGAHIRHARHAVAIDECRKDFHPTLWVNETGRAIYHVEEKQRSVKQLWFCGMHTDIGGGENRLVTNIALRWMLEEAKACGLPLKANALDLEMNSHAPLTPESHLFAGIKWTRYPRAIPRLDAANVGLQLHASVIERCTQTGYRPTLEVGAKGISIPLVHHSRARTQSWVPSNVWLENGETYSAQKKGGAALRIVGYIANSGNPRPDGTCPTHERISLEKPFRVKNGGGYLYFTIFLTLPPKRGRPPKKQEACIQLGKMAPC